MLLRWVSTAGRSVVGFPGEAVQIGKNEMKSVREKVEEGARSLGVGDGMCVSPAESHGRTCRARFDAGVNYSVLWSGRRRRSLLSATQQCSLLLGFSVHGNARQQPCVFFMVFKEIGTRSSELIESFGDGLTKIIHVRCPSCVFFLCEGSKDFAVCVHCVSCCGWH